MSRDFNLINGAVLKEINRKKDILEKDPMYRLSLNSKRRKNIDRLLEVDLLEKGRAVHPFQLASPY